MVLPRTAFMRNVLRAARTQAATRATVVRQGARRGYASTHTEKKSSDLPWALGAAAFTVPAAGWLWSQGPDTSHSGDHGHDEHAEASSKDDEEDKGEEEGEGEEEEESKGDESEDKPEEKVEEDGGDSEESESKPKGKGKKDPDAPRSDSSTVKSAGGEGSKVKESKTDSKRESQNEKSGSQHPYLDDDSKSKKGAGVKETAKLHGTVDASQPLRGAKDSGKGSSQGAPKGSDDKDDS